MATGYQDISNQSTYNGGHLGAVNGFIFHHTGPGMNSASDVVNTLNQRHLGVQYVMDRDGQIYRTLPQGAQGAHIQNSPNTNLSNANTEGMEIIANDNTDLTPAQLTSAKQFGLDYSNQHPGVQFYGHGQINPGHKEAEEGYTVANEVRAELKQPTLGPGGVSPAPYTPGSYQFASGGQTPTPDDNRQLVYDALTSKEIGLTPKTALGVMWSLGGESGGTLASGINEKGKAPGTGGYGIAQWTGTRRTALEAFAQQAGKNVNDPNLQVDYLKSELLGSERASLDHLRTLDNSEAAARVTTAEFERPAVTNSDARIALGPHVGTVDASGKFVAGDAKAPTRTGGTTPPAKGGQTPPTVGGTAAQAAVDPRLLMTPQQNFEMSIGSALGSLGSGGGGQPEDPPDQPAIRSMALEGTGTNPAPNPVPQEFAGGVGGQLGQLAATTVGQESDPTASITQGAPSMTAMLGGLGTPETYNMMDPRATRSPALTMRTPRIG